MKHYFFRLIPPRPTFPMGMSLEEAALMREHAAYWSGLMNQGLVHAFGPVLDPEGPHGIALATLEDQADPQALGAADPVMMAGIGFRIEVLPMAALVLPGKS